MRGLRLNVKKTEYLTTEVNESGYTETNGTELSHTSVFKHMESAIASDGKGIYFEYNNSLPKPHASTCLTKFSLDAQFTIPVIDETLTESLRSEHARASS